MALRKSITVTVWFEQIDSKAAAACAMAREVWRGGIYAASTMMLFNPTSKYRWQARDEAIAKLTDEVVRGVHVQALPRADGGWGCYVHQHNMLPLVGHVRDEGRH
jgi:hypothetical protein